MSNSFVIETYKHINQNLDKHFICTIKPILHVDEHFDIFNMNVPSWFKNTLVLIWPYSIACQSSTHQAGWSLEEPTQDNKFFLGHAILGLNPVFKSGTAYAVSGYVVNTNRFIVQFWRKVAGSDNDFTLLNSTDIFPSSINCRQDYILPECVPVQPGDFVGVYAPVLPWALGMYGNYPHGPYPLGYDGSRELEFDNTIPRVGETKTFVQEAFTSRFAFVVHISEMSQDELHRTVQGASFDGLPLNACNIQSTTPSKVGSIEVTDPGDLNSDGWVTLVSVISHSANLTKWTARFRSSGKAVFQIWKPSNYKETIYELLESYGPFHGPGNYKTAEFDVVPPLEVQPGYRIGYMAPLDEGQGALALQNVSNAKYNYDTRRGIPVVGRQYRFHYQHMPVIIALEATISLNLGGENSCILPTSIGTPATRTQEDEMSNVTDSPYNVTGSEAVSGSRPKPYLYGVAVIAAILALSFIIPLALFYRKWRRAVINLKYTPDVYGNAVTLRSVSVDESTTGQELNADENIYDELKEAEVNETGQETDHSTAYGEVNSNV